MASSVAFAFAFQQRVRRNGGAHFHRGDRTFAITLHQSANPGRGRIAVMAGILRKQLLGHQRTASPPAYDVREGPAAVDPEFPVASL